MSKDAGCAGKKITALVFDEIKRSGLICFLGKLKIKIKTCLSHLFFKKVA